MHDEIEEKEKPEQIMTSREILKLVSRTGRMLSESAEEYLAMIDENPPIEVIPGNHYRTYDGSIVFVVKREGVCRCPVCTGGYIDTPLGRLELPEAMKESIEKRKAEHEESSEKRPRYHVIVLRGGHGVVDVTAEEPGESYFVGKDGQVIFTKPEHEGATRAQVAMAGMSLKQLMKVSIDPVAAEPVKAK